MPGMAPRVLHMLTCLICQALMEQVLAFPPLYRCWYRGSGTSLVRGHSAGTELQFGPEARLWLRGLDPRMMPA